MHKGILMSWLMKVVMKMKVMLMLVIMMNPFAKHHQMRQGGGCRTRS
jgi:hypothetical protein